MRIKVDTSEVRELVADMTGIDSRLSRWVGPAVEKGAHNIKEDLQAQARKSKHFKGMAPGISYTMHTGIGGMYAADIGPEKGSPGSLGNIAYFGTSRGGGTVENPEAALQREAPKFEKALADLAADLVLGK